MLVRCGKMRDKEEEGEKGDSKEERRVAGRETVGELRQRVKIRDIKADNRVLGSTRSQMWFKSDFFTCDNCKQEVLIYYIY